MVLISRGFLGIGENLANYIYTQPVLAIVEYRKAKTITSCVLLFLE